MNQPPRPKPLEGLRRLWRRFVRLGGLVNTIAAVCYGLGGLFLWEGRPAGVLPGWIFLGVGASITLHALYRMLVRWVLRRRYEAKRKIVLQNRRERRKIEKEKRQEVAKQKPLAKSVIVMEKINSQDMLRSLKVLHDAESLRGLVGEERRQVVVHAFEQKGWRVEGIDDEAGCDFELWSEDNVLSGVVRLLPEGRRAEIVDIRLLADWKKSEGEITTYLVGTSGFSERAVILAQSAEVHLVEEYLLAQWLAKSPKTVDTE